MVAGRVRVVVVVVVVVRRGFALREPVSALSMMGLLPPPGARSLVAGSAWRSVVFTVPVGTFLVVGEDTELATATLCRVVVLARLLLAALDELVHEPQVATACD